MKKSYYNFLFPQNSGKTVLYNARTGAMAELDAEHSELLRKCSEEEIKQIKPDFADALLFNGFAVENDVSELDMIKYDSLRARFGNRSLNLTIAPTQDCNFCCAYCFEKQNMKATYMDEDTTDALIRYVQQNSIPEGKLEICWYGGEPLLAMNKIEELTESFLKICKEKRIEYNASIITNGYLLTEDVVHKLIKCKVSVVQITLDGARETHDCRRPLKGGCVTYDVIWGNLLALKKFEKQLFVHLRVNVDKENDGALEEVRTKIEQESMTEFVLVYPGKVVSSGNCYKKDACYNNQEFALLEQEYFSNYNKYLSVKYPKPIHNSCCTDDNNAMVIDADGRMYKCWMDIGDKKRAVGNINCVGECNEKLLYDYMLHDALEDENCKLCKYLPICLGGCPYQRLSGKRDCTSLKYTLDKYMNYFPEEAKKNGIS